MFLLMFLIFLIIPLIFISLNLIMFKKMNFNREKISLFECGFDSMSNMRMPFSIHFFLISLLFLIFDVEISLLIPFIYLMKFFNLIILYSLFIFMMILILGLYIEFIENMLEWNF